MSADPSQRLALAVLDILGDIVGAQLVADGRPDWERMDLLEHQRISSGERALLSFAVSEWRGQAGSLSQVVSWCDAGVRGRVLDAVVASHAMDRIVDGVLAETFGTLDWANGAVLAVRALLDAWDPATLAEYERLVGCLRAAVSPDLVPPEITAAAHAGIAAARAQHPTASQDLVARVIALADGDTWAGVLDEDEFLPVTPGTTLNDGMDEG